MAPALSTTPSSRPRLEWHGEAVTVGDVVSALNRIRREFAQAEAGDEEHPHPRNCVMTLVAITTNEEEERRAQRASEAIAALHPSLAIVVREEPTVRSGHIDAAIAIGAQTNASAPSVQFELVTLRVPGVAGEHLAAILDPLLVSGVPTYLWWLGTPPFGTRELVDALRICDALVIDSTHFARPYHSFMGLVGLTSTSDRRLGLADLQWARTAPWRETIAQFFEPKDRRPFLAGIGELGIDYAGDGRGNRIGAALLIGWFASALGWNLKRASAGGGGVVSAYYATGDGRSVQVAFRSVAKARLERGEVSAVRFAGAAGGKTFQVSIQRDPERARAITSDVGPTGFQHQHSTGGDDDAGREVAERKAAQHREMLFQNRETLHHTATGDAPGENVPRHPTVAVRDRRRGDSSLLLLTLIDIGGAETLRHVQRVESRDEAALLLELLSAGAHDAVHSRSLAAGAELIRAL